LTGIVRDSATCQPIHEAELSYIVVGSYETYPSGKVTTDAEGNYQIESDLKSRYTHLLVTIRAPGYEMAVADYSLVAGQDDSTPFDLVLQPES